MSCDFDYSLSVIVGKLSEKKWIALCSTVPQETPSYFDDEIICCSYRTENDVLKSIDNLDSEIAIQKYIEQLASIQIYGWYDGGYNHVHEYKIVAATGESKEIALENALLQSKLLEIYKFKSFNISEQLECYHDDEAQEIAIKSSNLNKFFKKSFPEVLLYRLCFWDYEHLYILGEKGDRNRVGITLHSQFTYNP